MTLDEFGGISNEEAVDALLNDPAVFLVAEGLPEHIEGRGGRPRHHPNWVYIFVLALTSKYLSARKAVLEVRSMWRLIDSKVRELYPGNDSLRLGERPIQRHQWVYMKRLALQDPDVLPLLKLAFEKAASRTAVEILGLCSPGRGASLTHPNLDNMLYGDGKVITPLYRARRGDKRVDRETGEIKPRRFDPDAGPHVTGGGVRVYGNKFVLIATRNEDIHGRVIVAIDWVPRSEAEVAVSAALRASELMPGALGLIYDGALRGAHAARLLRGGLLPVAPVTSEKGGRASGTPRVEKEGSLGSQKVKRQDGSKGTVQLRYRAGTVGIADLDDAGNPVFVPLERTRTSRRPRSDGSYRWFNELVVPASHGGGVVRVRCDQTEEDDRRGFNRCENVRVIPPSDPDFKGLYSRRADAEAINRQLEDSLWCGRAHSVGAQGQLLDLLGFGLLYNAVARWRAVKRAAPAVQAAA